MNNDILNIGKYRLSTDGRNYYLFNRESDKVHTITKEHYQYIKIGDPGTLQMHRCFDVEGWMK